MSARDEGYQYGIEVKQQWADGLNEHPMSQAYRTTTFMAAYQGGVRAGQLGYATDTQEGSDFASGFSDGLRQG